MFWIYLKGFSIGAGLIIAIGAQNAFVLNQGVRRNSIFIIPLICALSDAMLILLGITGVGTFIASNQTLKLFAAIAGSAYLCWIGLNSLKSAWKGDYLKINTQTENSLLKTVLATLGVTYLNPHVYIDTVIFMGSISAQFETLERYYFAAGAITCSFLWFFSLSLGGRALSPILTRRSAWRVLDTIIGLTMLTIAVSLLKSISRY